MATPSSVLAWRTPWTEEPGGLQSTGPQRVGHDLVTRKQQQQKARYQATWHQPLGLSLPTVFKGSNSKSAQLLTCLTPFCYSDNKGCGPSFAQTPPASQRTSVLSDAVLRTMASAPFSWELWVTNHLFSSSLLLCVGLTTPEYRPNPRDVTRRVPRVDPKSSGCRNFPDPSFEPKGHFLALYF